MCHNTHYIYLHAFIELSRIYFSDKYMYITQIYIDQQKLYEMFKIVAVFYKKNVLLSSFLF